jgi:hypothetical protein
MGRLCITDTPIEPDDWLSKARQDSRRLVIAAGLSDDDIDRLIKRAQKEVEPRAGGRTMAYYIRQTPGIPAQIWKIDDAVAVRLG